MVKKIKEIAYKETENSSRDTGDNPHEDEYSLKFSYFEDGSVARIVKEGKGGYDSDRYTSTYNFDYSIVGEIQVTKEDIHEWSSEPVKTYYTVTLDDRGNAVKLQKKNEYETGMLDVANFGYTNDVRLGKVVTYDYGNKCNDIFSYENGLMIKHACLEEYGENNEYSFDESYYVNKYSNNNMVDMMGYLLYGDTEDYEFNFLFYIGRLAKTSDYCFEKIPDYIDDYDVVNEIPDYSKRQEANKLIEKVSGKGVKYSEEPIPVDYTYDSEKNITGLKISIPYEVYKYSYEIWTTEEEEYHEEFIDGEFVKVKCYGVETRNSKTEYVKSGKNYATYTINY